MIGVEQDILAPPNGNCYAACVASILELPLSEVPNFTAPRWFQEWNEWLRLRGLMLLSFTRRPNDDWKPAGYSIMGVMSPRGDFQHAVVALDGDLAWDPHPQRAMGIGKVMDYAVFQALFPEQVQPYTLPAVDFPWGEPGDLFWEARDAGWGGEIIRAYELGKRSRQ